LQNKFELLFAVRKRLHARAKYLRHCVQRCPESRNFLIASNGKARVEIAGRKLSRYDGNFMQRPQDQDAHPVAEDESEDNGDNNRERELRRTEEKTGDQRNEKYQEKIPDDQPGLKPEGHALSCVRAISHAVTNLVNRLQVLSFIAELFPEPP